MEYLGQARQGRAEGTGGMIARYRSQVGAYYFEGTFKGGVPHGVLRVEEPGSKVRFREFSAGRDVGSGNAGAVQRLVF